MKPVSSIVAKVQMESSVESQKASREDINRAVDQERKLTQESYDKEMKEVDENKSSREKENKGALLGTIFGGFLIGGLIGKAIGNAVGEGNRDAAGQLKKEVGFTDLQYDKAKDRGDDAKETLDEAEKKQHEADQFRQELRDSRFNSIE